MKNLKKLSAVVLAVAMFWTSSAFAAELTDVNLEITAWVITPFAPDTVSLWTTAVSNAIQYVTTWATAYDGSVTSSGESEYDSWFYFGIKDLKWASDNLAITLQASNMTAAWGKVITNEKITIAESDSASSWTDWDIWASIRWLTKMDGLPGNIIPAELSGVLFAHNANDDNLSGAWLPILMWTTRSEWYVWRYWVQPEFKILIPAYQAIGAYTGELTLTFTDS